MEKQKTSTVFLLHCMWARGCLMHIRVQDSITARPALDIGNFTPGKLITQSISKLQPQPLKPWSLLGKKRYNQEQTCVWGMSRHLLSYAIISCTQPRNVICPHFFLFCFVLLHCFCFKPAHPETVFPSCSQSKLSASVVISVGRINSHWLQITGWFSNLCLKSNTYWVTYVTFEKM